MNKKLMFGLLIIFSFLAVSANAKPKEQLQKSLSADDILFKMTKQLGLSEKQVDEVKPIVMDFLAKEKKLELDEKRQLGRVLTGDQMYAWNFLQKEEAQENGKEKKKKK